MRWLLYIGIIIFLILAGCATAYWQMNRNPVVNVPTPVMPSPNAHDYYLKAAEVLYEKAPGIVPTYRSLSASSNVKTLTPHERELLLACQLQVEQIFLQGAGYTYLNPPVRSLKTLTPYYRKYRHLSRYFRFLAETHTQEQRWADAMEESLHPIRLGADIQHGSMLIGVFAGISCEAIGRGVTWDIVEHLNVVDTRKFLAIMQDINTREVPFTLSMQEEKGGMQTAVAELLRDPDWRRKLAMIGAEKPEERKKIELGLQFMNKRASFKWLTSYYDQCIAITQQPFSQRPQEDPPLAHNPLRVFAPVCLKAWLKVQQTHAGNRLLTVTLALHAYHEERARYPKALGELVSAGYLASLPADPFADAGTFRYRQSGTKYLLYSIGPDCKDDGGTPIKDEKNPKLPEHNPSLESKGDLVVGVNRI